MLSFLSDLIRLRSVCGVDAERSVAERICAECDHLKLKYDLISASGQEHRPNVIVTAGMSCTAFDYRLVCHTTGLCKEMVLRNFCLLVIWIRSV